MVNTRHKGGEMGSVSKITERKGKWWQYIGHRLQILVEYEVKLRSQAKPKKSVFVSSFITLTASHRFVWPLSFCYCFVSDN